MSHPYGSHPRERLAAFLARRRRFLTSHPVVAILTFSIAAVWIVFGVWFKLLGMVPRHRLIVATIVGEAAATPVTQLVGLAETALAVWIVAGMYPRLCASLQSVAIAAMNTLEIAFAKQHLIAPIVMVVANSVLLVVAWYTALRSSRTSE